MTLQNDDWRPSIGGKSLVALVPDYSTGKKSLLRLGVYDATDEANIFANLPDDWTAVSDSSKKVKELLVNGSSQPYPGWLEYTDGERTEVTAGNKREAIGADYNQYIKGNALIDVGGKYEFRIGAGTVEVWNADPIYKVQFFEQKGIFAAGKTTWRKREWGHVSADTYSFGDVENFFAGYKFDAMFGLTNNIFIGGKVDLSLTMGLSFSAGYALEFDGGVKYTHVKGKQLNVSSDNEIKAHKEIHLRVKDDNHLFKATKQKVAAGLVAAAGVATAGLLAIGTKDGEVAADGKAEMPTRFLSAAAGVFGVALIASLVIALKEKGAPKVSASEIKMDEDGVTIAHNTDLGVMQGKVYVGKGTTGPGLVWLRNHHGSFLQLHPDQDVALEAKKDLHLQTDSGNALIKLLNTGDIRIKATQANIQGNRITLGGNNELTIG